MLSSRLGPLCCALKSLAENIGKTTPTDIIVFSVRNSAEAGLRNACPGLQLGDSLLFMALDEHWETPHAAGSENTW